MSFHPLKSILALACSVAAVSASAQNNAATVPTMEGAPSVSGAAGGSINGGGSAMAPAMGMAPTLSVSPGLGAAPSFQGAPVNSAAAPVAQAVAAPAQSAPGRAVPSPVSARGSSPVRSTPASPVAPNGSVPESAAGAPSDRAGSTSRAASSALTASPRSGVSGSGRGAAAAPGAGAALDGTARKISEARLAEGGDGLSVSRALDKAFDASLGRASLSPGGAAPGSGVAGRAQDVRGAIAQKVVIANTAAPSDAPSLYQDAIRTAKDSLPAETAAGVESVVRSFAGRKAESSLGDLASSAFTAAARGSAPETGRQLSAFDKWQELLGTPGRPLISNLDALKSGVSDLLKSAQAGSARSAPHVWFEKKDGAYAAVLPGPRVAAVPALAAAFAISPAALAPETALSDAYRAFSSDPRASNGAGLVYRARRALGSSVPAAALEASRFWLRAAFEALWRRVAALFSRRPAYELSRKAGQDALRRDAAAAETARGEASAARRLLSGARLTVSAARAAFAALARSSDAYRALTGERDAGAAVEALRRSFESAAAEKGLRGSDELPAGLAELVSGPGAAAHWAERLEAEAGRAVDERFWRGRSSGAFVNLGADRSPAASAAAVAQSLAGTPLTTVALDDRFWTRGRGPNGEARLAAELRGTSSGGSVELYVERADASLSRRLEDMGLTVLPSGPGLRAVAGPEDFAYGGDELGPLSARALAAALGRTEPDAGAELRALASETRRDPSSAARLAGLLDGREAFARAPVIGLVGDYEALAPMSVVVAGKPLLVSALRDPDTGLLAYARASRPDGAPLGAAELRALLPRGR